MRNNNKAEILVVDDDFAAAQNFAEYITVRLNINAIAETNITEVFNIIKNEPIKVAVLDQRMPEMSGTEVYKKILQINPYIKAIMLTGEANREEVAEAMRIGYVDFLEKKNVDQLPNKVMIAYTKYQIELCHKSKKELSIQIKPSKSFFGYKNLLTKYEICSIKELNKEFIFEDKWKTTLELEAAEKEQEETYDFLEEIILQEDNQLNTSLKNSFPELEAFNLKTDIGIAINKYTGKKYIRNYKKGNKTKNIYKLQDGVEEGKIAIKKIYERTPVYIQYHIIIKKTCNFCGKVQLIPFYLYKSLPKEKTRVVIYYSSKEHSCIDTGIISH